MLSQDNKEITKNEDLCEVFYQWWDLLSSFNRRSLGNFQSKDVALSREEVFLAANDLRRIYELDLLSNKVIWNLFMALNEYMFWKIRAVVFSMGHGVLLLIVDRRFLFLRFLTITNFKNSLIILNIHDYKIGKETKDFKIEKILFKNLRFHNWNNIFKNSRL